MKQNDQWTAEFHTDADLGFHPSKNDTTGSWCAVAPVNNPTAEPVLGYIGRPLPDGRNAYPFMDQGTAQEAANDENGMM